MNDSINYMKLAFEEMKESIDDLRNVRNKIIIYQFKY